MKKSPQLLAALVESAFLYLDCERLPNGLDLNSKIFCASAAFSDSFTLDKLP
jgi:hypothetical protein